MNHRLDGAMRRVVSGVSEALQLALLSGVRGVRFACEMARQREVANSWWSSLEVATLRADLRDCGLADDHWLATIFDAHTSVDYRKRDNEEAAEQAELAAGRIEAALASVPTPVGAAGGPIVRVTLGAQQELGEVVGRTKRELRVIFTSGGVVSVAFKNGHSGAYTASTGWVVPWDDADRAIRFFDDGGGPRRAMMARARGAGAPKGGSGS